MNPEPSILSKYLQSHFPNATYQAAYESSFCGFWIQKQLSQSGISCIVVHAADIPTSDKEKRHKNDRSDSRKIAKSLRAGQLEPIYVPDDIALDDRCITRYRKSIVKDITRNKNRIKALLYLFGIHMPHKYQKNRWSGSFINWLATHPDIQDSKRIILNRLLDQLSYSRNQLADVHKQYREMARSGRYCTPVRCLLSIPGIGLISAMTWILELVDIRRFPKFDNLCSYVGLVPSENSSGEKTTTGPLDNRGNRILRTALIESARVAARKDPDMSLTYLKLSNRMEKNKAIIRVARKLLNRIRFVLINEVEYQPQVTSNN